MVGDIDQQQMETEGELDVWPEVVDVELHLPTKQIAFLPAVNANETLVSIRQALAEFQETAFFTCFKWKFRHILNSDNQVIPKEVVGDALEFSELSAFLESSAKKVVFDLVADLYDAKKVKLHVKRVRDIVNRQFLLSAAPSAYEAANRISEGYTGVDESKSLNEKVSIPKVDQLPETAIGSFFQETLKTDVSKTALEPVQLPLAGVIKSIFISGWNPIPSYRRLQGDLLYIEVVFVTEGTFYITATSRGFYVNRSNRAVFDPSPANSPHFYHNLFDTLSDLSVNVKNAWSVLCDRSKTWSTTIVPGALDAVVHLYSSFNGDFHTLPVNTWIVPGGDKKDKDGFALAASPPSYDMLRTQDFLSDLHGAEDFSAPREWNDEIQSIRTLKANDLPSKILKARLEHRMISEFTEACKKIVVAISEGLISPLIYSDPSQSDIYVYNGIFFSRAEDTKDSYGIHIGEEAARKSAARDFQNQKLIRSLEIANMNNILCTIVDYKGIRYVGQSIIPGIFNQGEHCAQLMYGVLEKGKTATIKHSSLSVFEELAKKLQLTKRNISAVPFNADEEISTEGVGDVGHIDALTELLKTADANQSTPIRVDDIGNIDVDPVTNSLPHCGPIEGKLLRGSDGRTYVLEVMRLTPRDANYVSSERGGSLRINDEDLSKSDISIGATYILRQELIGIYMQRRVNMARQALLNELAGKERLLLKKDKSEESKKSDAAVSVEDVHKDDEEEDAVQIVKEEKSEEENQLSEEEQEKLALEYREKFAAITPESLGIEINPNVFLNCEADVDPTVAAKDEAAAREMAIFLYDSVLPMLTRQVREGDVSPKDPESMVNLLHRMGVNMRYLGRLAKLALEQEREDAELMFQNKQRVHSMPYFWLEFLTVELLARSAKHILNMAMKSDSAIAASPAGTISALLNNFLSLLKEPVEGVSESKEVEIQPVVAVESEKKATKKIDKKTRKVPKVVASSAVADAIGKLEITQIVFPTVATKDSFAATLADVLQKKYLYDSPLLAKAENIEGLDDKAAWGHMQNALLRSRIAPLMLIRRICQQCGIVLACRFYDLKKPVSSSGPFHVNDILGLVPKVKSCEPESYLNEVPEMLATSSSYLSQGNAVAAFELAQQALNFISQITGATHPHTLQASEQLTSVLINSADIKSASQMTTRTLALIAQVHGIDNSSMVQYRLHLATFETEQGNYQLAFNHLTTAKYLLEAVGGDHHPDMILIFTRLSMLYEKVNDFDSSLHCLLRARMFVHDLVNNAGITVAIANLLFRYNRFHEAVHAQKSAYKILKELMSPDDERVGEAKKNLEAYIRAAATAPRPVEFSSNSIVQPDLNLVSDAQVSGDDADKDAKKKKSNKKRGKK